MQTHMLYVGLDGITSDWVHCYGDLPVDLEPANSMQVLRNGERIPCEVKTLTIGETILHCCDCTLPTGEMYHFFAQQS